MRTHSPGRPLLATLTIGLTLLLPVLAGPGPARASAADERVVALVGATAVTAWDVDRELRRLLPLQSGTFHSGVSPEKMAALRVQALDAAIERTLKALGAPGAGATVDDAAVEAEFAKVAARFKSQDLLEKALGGESVTAFRSSLRRELLARAGEAAAVDAKAKVADEDLKTWYAANKNKYQTERMFKISEIRIGVDPAATDADRDNAARKATELLGRARGGEDFYNLAYFNSTDASRMVGGDRGWLRLGQSQAELDAAILKLHPGEISDVVKTIYGFHIVRLHEIQEPRVMTFDELKTTIRDILQKERRQKAYDTWLATLRGQHAVRKVGK